MKKIILIYSCLLVGLNSIQAQDDSRSFQIGVGAEGLAFRSSSTSSQLGVGQQVRLWLALPVGIDDAIKIAVGYRRLSGFKEQSIRILKRSMPSEYQITVFSKRLLGLNYWDLSLVWEKRFNHSSWTVQGGLKLGATAKVVGKNQITMRTRGYEARIAENSFFASYDETSWMGASNLEKADFTPYDFGLLIGVGFEVTTGLQMNAGYYIGMSNVYAENFSLSSDQLRLSAFSLGFSARLF